MRRVLKNTFVPHAGNHYAPHLLREASVLTLTALIIALFVVSNYPITDNARFTAEVLPTVLVDMANSDRRVSNESALTINPLLQSAAQEKANDMLAKGYFAHTSPEGITPWHWFNDVGYSYAYAGENLAMGFFESNDVNQAWLNSPLHRQNILNQNFTEIGIATSHGLYRGVETTFVVQMFGKPLAKSAVPIAKAQETPKPMPTPTMKPVAIAPPPVPAEMFIAVQNNEVAGAAVPAITPITTAPKHYASWLDRFISSPKKDVAYAYLLLGAIILIAVLISIFTEIKKQHPKHIIFGAALLVLMLALVYVNQALVLSAVLVI